MSLRKMWKNFKWAILNDPPTSIHAAYDLKCDYCGVISENYNYCNVVTICASCRKKVFDAVLKEKK